MVQSLSLDVIEDSTLLESLINPIFNDEKLEDSRKWEIVGLTKPKEDPKRDLYFVSFKASNRLPLLIVLQSIISRVIKYKEEPKLSGFNPVVFYDEKKVYGFRPGCEPGVDQSCTFFIVDSINNEDFMIVVPGFINKEGSVIYFKDNSVFTVDTANVLFWSPSTKEESSLDIIKTAVSKLLKKFHV